MTATRYDIYRWRRVTGEQRVPCAIGSALCREQATWCNEWATASMSGLAFYYYCDGHAPEAGLREWQIDQEELRAPGRAGRETRARGWF